MKTTRPLPNHVYLKSILKYFPHNGTFVWKQARGCVKRGTIAGQNNNKGYISIRIDGLLYYAHRLAYYYMTECDPGELEIDHRDRNRSNCKFSNLRLATRSDNLLNHGRISRYTIKSHNRYMAKFSLRNIDYYLGCFATEEEAHQVSLLKRNELL